MKGGCTISFIGLVLKAMPLISRGFHHRRRTDVDAARVPPGQYVVNDFPVLSAGPTPTVPFEQWSPVGWGPIGCPCWAFLRPNTKGL
jgi:hypothetical protein